MNGHVTAQALIAVDLLAMLVSGLKNPVHVWPLAYNSLTWDVQKGTLDSANLSGACPALSTNSQFGFSSFLYDGSGQSAADLRLTSSGVLPKVTFAFYLNPDLLDGVFFEYRCDVTPDPSKVIFDRIMGELVGGLVRMSVWRGSQMEWSTHPRTLSVGTWNSVMLTLNDADELSITIGSEQQRAPFSTIAHDDGTQVPGWLRIGQSWSRNSTFHGKMNCVVFYDDDIKISEVTFYETNTCPEAKWNKPPTGVASCPATIRLYNKAFRLVASNAQPTYPCPAQISCAWAKSTVQCASLCVMTPHCRSFVIARAPTSQLRQCQLFDYVSKTCLVTMTDKYFYEITY